MINRILAIVLGIVSLTSSLSAAQSHAIETSKDQSVVASIQAPQALKDFVQQAVQQGLSVDEIVEQALAQGYTREQVVSACSMVMVQEDEALSTQDIVVWGMLSVGAIATVGVGLWFTYKWLTSETGAGNENGEPRLHDHGDAPRVQEQADHHEPQVVVRRYHIAPIDGAMLPGDGNQRVNQLFEQGLAAGRDYNDLVREVRQMFPDVAFQVNRGVEIARPGVDGVALGLDRYAAWNQDGLRDINIEDLMCNF